MDNEMDEMNEATPFYQLFKRQFVDLNEALIMWDYHQKIISSLDNSEPGIIPQAKIIAAICFKKMNCIISPEFKIMVEKEADKLIRSDNFVDIDLFNDFNLKIEFLYNQ